MSSWCVMRQVFYKWIYQDLIGWHIAYHNVPNAKRQKKNAENINLLFLDVNFKKVRLTCKI